MFVHYSQCFSGHLEHLWLQLGILDMSFLKENANWRVPLDFGFWICWSIISLCQSIFKKSTSPTDLGKMECTFLLCSIVRIVVGKTEKNRTDSCVQQENSDSRTMWDDCMKWNFDHQRLYKMDLLKLNVRNQFCVPCFLHFECQRNTSSTIVAYVKKHFASWHCEESISSDEFVVKTWTTTSC